MPLLSTGIYNVNIPIIVGANFGIKAKRWVTSPTVYLQETTSGVNIIWKVCRYSQRCDLDQVFHFPQHRIVFRIVLDNCNLTSLEKYGRISNLKKCTCQYAIKIKL